MHIFSVLRSGRAPRWTVGENWDKGFMRYNAKSWEKIYFGLEIGFMDLLLQHPYWVWCWILQILSSPNPVKIISRKRYCFLIFLKIHYDLFGPSVTLHLILSLTSVSSEKKKCLIFSSWNCIICQIIVK